MRLQSAAIGRIASACTPSWAAVTIFLENHHHIAPCIRKMQSQQDYHGASQILRYHSKMVSQLHPLHGEVLSCADSGRPALGKIFHGPHGSNHGATSSTAGCPSTRRCLCLGPERYCGGPSQCHNRRIRSKSAPTLQSWWPHLAVLDTARLLLLDAAAECCSLHCLIDLTMSLHILLGSGHRGQAPLLSSEGPLLGPATTRCQAGSCSLSTRDSQRSRRVRALPWQKLLRCRQH